ncbi:MAG: cell division protein ZapA [Zetaproteobacteria bacterium CG_4_9_14_3_um_filter_49_83]|nr:MAG: cell division protein ZapA [Zetaproteobacteria bacterium CG1_02_49_23]PIQ31762.1 MAG: cell division protein ZapA [Zetaproteobacteria bacterium CG17_big_fil_post_rev_8_21_14_2_50_50_13]PIV30544.1 MAG: cell division protein ZapA [Zetaproteobacteria bacterium CG02_land_8_20_14_3_00_50_9]PIY56633.1 MAG: cell division protein ZapA [Zetaproteobacteria bacterium CG_4_10_14_0_8_um_filter_49_80]PJA34188.1 MAG: cell division protein ZapA [Zetaproteobacteria bacterium CG_4_9_14_3_um_filter_49_83]
MHKVEVIVAGRSYTIRTEDNPEHVQAAAAMIESQLNELKQIGSTVGTDRLMALVALNLAGQLLNQKVNQSTELGGLISSLETLVSQAEGLAKAPLR